MRALLLGALVAPLALRAQTSVLSLDAGVSRMRFADSLEASALSLAPSLRFSGSRASLAASATLSRLGGSSTSSGLLDASLFTPARRGLSMEINGVAGGSSHSDGSTTAQLLAGARAHLDGAAAGLWLGGAAGGSSVDVWRPMIQGDVGAWAARGAASFSARAMPTMVEDTIRYTDLWLAARREGAVWEIGASLGARAGSSLPSLTADDDLWGSVSAAYSLTPRVAIVASAGTYPVDLTQGYPGGRYVTLILRLRRATGAGAVTATAEPVPPMRQFESVRLPSGATRIRVIAPTASRIELAGDFTSWRPVSLRQVNGVWTVDLSISAGTHEVSVRADGGAWIAPPGLVEVKDEFGGSAGLLRVP